MSSELEKIDYSFPSIGKSKWVGLIFIIFFIGVFLYFPLTYKVKSILKENLSRIPGCPLSYREIGTEFFLPKLIISDLVIPMSCFNQYGQPITLKETKLNFRGISFSPFGPHFMLETTVLKNNISAYLTAGIGGFAINIRENKLDLKTLLQPVKKIKLTGSVIVDALVKISSGEVSDLKINIISKDLGVPAQSIQGFKLYNLKLNNLLLKAKNTDKKLIIEDFIIGDANSPIRSSFKGDMKMNMRNFLMSQVDIKGEAFFSKEFIDKYAFIKILMAKFNKKDDFYQVEIKGPLNAPTTSTSR